MCSNTCTVLAAGAAAAAAAVPVVEDVTEEAAAGESASRTQYHFPFGKLVIVPKELAWGPAVIRILLPMGLEGLAAGETVGEWRMVALGLDMGDGEKGGGEE
jgi:hypothetical protein